MQKALTGPKHSLTFRNKYLAVVLSVAAFLLSSVSSFGQGAAPPGYAPKVYSYGNWYNRLRADSAQHIPNKAGLFTNDNDSTPQLFIFNDTLRGYWNGTFRTIGGSVSGGIGVANGISISGGNYVLGGNPLIQNTTIHGAFHNFTFDSLNIYKINTLNVGTGFNVTEQISPGGYFRQVWNGLAAGSGAVISNFSSSLSGSDGTLGLTIAKGTGGTFVPSVQLNTIDSSLVLEGHIIKLVSDTSWAGAEITIDALPYTVSTTNMASVGWNNVTKQVFAIPYAGGGGGGASDVVTTITSGTSSTVPNGTNILQFTNSSNLTYTVTLPTTWHSSHGLFISLDGTGTVTITIVNGSGQTLSQSVNPNGTTFNPGEGLEYHLIGTIDHRKE